MNNKPYVIGVLGGMGTYATIHIFRQYAEIFPAEKEWERPRIVIDNRCTMPSRVRAALYGECREKLIREISDSIENLMNSGCNRILLGCNTAHLFLPDIYKEIPDAEKYVVNIIDVCADGLRKDDIGEVFLLASEGTIESAIYQEALEARKIRCIVPDESDYSCLRECIEAVKTNRDTDVVSDIFQELIHRGSTCILGCTELPILYEKNRDICSDIRVYDPFYMALSRIRKEYEEQKR